ISWSLWYVDFAQFLMLCSEFWWRRIEVERILVEKYAGQSSFGWRRFLVERISDIGMGLGSFLERIYAVIL
ncbi:hypothetical protein U1Q18_042483, partial [Sarracenia purpurea var. burkii]